MTAELTGAVIDPGRIQVLVEELVMQISANSIQERTINEAESLPENERRALARTVFRRNFNLALIYNTSANLTLGPASERPYGV